MSHRFLSGLNSLAHNGFAGASEFDDDETDWIFMAQRSTDADSSSPLLKHILSFKEKK